MSCRGELVQLCDKHGLRPLKALLVPGPDDAVCREAAELVTAKELYAMVEPAVDKAKLSRQLADKILGDGDQSALKWIMDNVPAAKEEADQISRRWAPALAMAEENRMLRALVMQLQQERERKLHRDPAAAPKRKRPDPDAPKRQRKTDPNAPKKPRRSKKEDPDATTDDDKHPEPATQPIMAGGLFRASV